MGQWPRLQEENGLGRLDSTSANWTTHIIWTKVADNAHDTPESRGLTTLLDFKSLVMAEAAELMLTYTTPATAKEEQAVRCMKVHLICLPAYPEWQPARTTQLYILLRIASLRPLAVVMLMWTRWLHNTP